MAQEITVLDGYTLNPGDISWEPFSARGELTVYDRTPDGLVLERAAGIEYLLTNKTILTGDILRRLNDLRYVGSLATGYDTVDLEVARARGGGVTIIPTYDTDSVAQHATALMLEFARGVGIHDRAVHEGEWSRSEDFCFVKQPMVELTGKTLGLIGLGRIGLAFARIASAMGMRVVAHDLYWPDAEKLEGLTIEQSTIDEVFEQADVISLHCPLTPETQHLVNAQRLALAKANALLINTSRGPLVDNAALATALVDGRIAGAALDVLDVEPPPEDNPLLTAPNCLITPHIAWYAAEARQRLMQIGADNLAAFLDGKPVNVVNP